MELLSRSPQTDALLLGWWLELGASGELVPMLGPWAESAAAFLAEFTRPDLRIWTVSDGTRWVAAVWSSPFMGGATYNFWIHPDRRGEPFLHAVIYGHGLLLAAEYPVLLFVTRSEKVLGIAQKAGIEIAGEVPYLFYGDTAYIGYLTPFRAESLLQTAEVTNGWKNS
jgi:hypothetical protein